MTAPMKHGDSVRLVWGGAVAGLRTGLADSLRSLFGRSPRKSLLPQSYGERERNFLLGEGVPLGGRSDMWRAYLGMARGTSKPFTDGMKNAALTKFTDRTAGAAYAFGTTGNAECDLAVDGRYLKA